MTTSVNLRSLLETNKLTGPNFLDWLRNLRIVLRSEGRGYVLDIPLPDPPAVGASDGDQKAYHQHLKDSDIAQCIMLASMSPELQKQHESMDAYTIVFHLRELFDEQARSERFETSRLLFTTKMTPGSSAVQYALKMNGYIERLAVLGFVMDFELSIDLILVGLSDSFSQFVLNYRMNQMASTIPELINLLKTAEQAMRKDSKELLVVESTSSGSKKRKLKKKKGKRPKESPTGSKAKKKKTKETAPKGTCFHCGKTGHWRRNCKVYLEELKQKKASDASTSSGMFVIEVNTVSDQNTWVFDTGCGSHICTDMQGLRDSRQLSKGEVDLRVGNGARVAALAVGTYFLSLPSGLVLRLDDCYFVPVLTKNILSVSCLNRAGFHLTFSINGCSISSNGMLYGTGTLCNGIYILDMSHPIMNVNDTKRHKRDNLKSTYLWHCRLGHINERRIAKLHKSGSLGSFDYESYDTCESCLLGKMTKLPFKGKGERATGLLDLIHSDVCGPMSIHARSGSRYFITFIDDYSRYGYLYLMRYKSEAFEKFKLFRNEVEKQLGQSIKTLRSDRGGEYLDQEFLDYLRDNGILSQWTPPYTPQHNGVAERRNRTLLDMVRSMMGFAQLPKSFWGYALETAVYLLNRVPSKTVDVTPYVIWANKNLIFLI